MISKGVLSVWDDAKGFGFITPEDGGERVFAHISSYAGRGRPASDRKVTYSISKDDQGRLRAGRSGLAACCPEAATLRQQLDFGLLNS